MTSAAAKQTKPRRFLYSMVLSYTLVFAGLLAVILGIIFFILSASERTQAQLNHRLLLAQPLGQVEKFIGEMDDLAYNAMANQDLIATFARLRDEGNPVNHFTTNVMDDIDTGSLLAGLNRGIRPAWRLSAYNQYGDFISTGTVVDKSMTAGVLQSRNPGAVMDALRHDDAGYLLYPPGRDPWSNYYKSSYVSLLRPIMNSYSRDAVGVVEVQQNIRVLEEYLATAPGSGLLVNVYGVNGAPIVEQAADGYVQAAAAVEQNSGWRVVLLEHESVAQNRTLRLLYVLVGVWVALVAVIAVVIALIARRISRPLTDLTREVRRIDVANPAPLAPVPTDIDEVEGLQTAFNQMLDSLVFSMGQEKKSFLLAMQAQMNPHFLYNVLSVINALAIEGKSDKVRAVCGNLSGMLRYSSSYDSGTATIREEVHFTRAYLELMQSRYDDAFRFEVEVDPALWTQSIPKLVIQPLCENAFTHSFEKMEPPYRLKLEVALEEGGWCIRVTDNGPGFSPDARETVLGRANAEDYGDLSKLQLGGLGIVSSVIRMRLMTRQQVHCSVENAAPRGSVVCIHVRETQGGEQP